MMMSHRSIPRKQTCLTVVMMGVTIVFNEYHEIATSRVNAIAGPSRDRRRCWVTVAMWVRVGNEKLRSIQKRWANVGKYAAVNYCSVYYTNTTSWLFIGDRQIWRHHASVPIGPIEVPTVSVIKLHEFNYVFLVRTGWTVQITQI